jgi:hypothetical protein
MDFQKINEQSHAQMHYSVKLLSLPQHDRIDCPDKVAFGGDRREVICKYFHVIPYSMGSMSDERIANDLNFTIF